MKSETSEIYVWVWLPGTQTPVPAGVLTRRGSGLEFSYGSKYLERPDAVSLSPTLELSEDTYGPTGYMTLPSAIRDAAPDAWGRRVILNRLTGHRGDAAETLDLPERTYLMESESDRIGALDFQCSPERYIARGSKTSLPDLQKIAEMVSAGEALPEELHSTVLSGTGIGGARPKALLTIDGVPSLVKFSMSTDVFPVVEAEAIASNLAARAGMSTAPVRGIHIGAKYALVSGRFDRCAGSGERRMVVSGLTIVGRDEIEARYGSYPELLQKLANHSKDPQSLGGEVFSRIAFNMMISNNDDHLRNHAAFWDGSHLELTPAYDLSPSERREGAETTQHLPFGGSGEKLANLSLLTAQAHVYGLSRGQANEIVDHLRGVISADFRDAADEMEIPSSNLAISRNSFLHETVIRDLPRPVYFSSLNPIPGS